MRPAGRLAENALNALCINIDDIRLKPEIPRGAYTPVGKMPSLLPLCPIFDSGAEKPLADAGHAAVGSYHGPSMATAATKVGGSYLSLASMIR